MADQFSTIQGAQQAINQQFAYQRLYDAFSIGIGSQARGPIGEQFQNILSGRTALFQGTTGGDTQQPTHAGNRIVRLVIAHELEPLCGIVFVSRANQAAALTGSPARACYYAWMKRRPSRRAETDAALIGRKSVRRMRPRAAPTVRRASMPSCDQGIARRRKRVARLLSQTGLAGVSRRKVVVTTVKPDSRPAPDLVDRDFRRQPDRLWVADITYVPTRAGFLYLAVVLDAFSRRIVGWAMAPRSHRLVLDALKMAVWHGGPGASSTTATRAARRNQLVVATQPGGMLRWQGDGGRIERYGTS